MNYIEYFIFAQLYGLFFSVLTCVFLIIALAISFIFFPEYESVFNISILLWAFVVGFLSHKSSVNRVFNLKSGIESVNIAVSEIQILFGFIPIIGRFFLKGYIPKLTCYLSIFCIFIIIVASVLLD